MSAYESSGLSFQSLMPLSTVSCVQALDQLREITELTGMKGEEMVKRLDTLYMAYREQNDRHEAENDRQQRINDQYVQLQVAFPPHSLSMASGRSLLLCLCSTSGSRILPVLAIEMEKRLADGRNLTLRNLWAPP